MLTPLPELNQHVDRWLRRLRLQRAVAWSGRGLLIGLALALVVALVAVFNGRLLREEFALVVAGAAGLGMFLAAVIAYAWPIGRLDAARFFDRRFGLRERVSTALELSSAAVRSTGELKERQLADALAASRTVEPRAHLPLRVDRVDILAAIALGACALFVAFRGDAFFQEAEQARAVQQAVAQEIEQIEAIRKAIAADESLTEEQRRELAQPLEETARRLRESESLEQATSVLTAGEEQLQALADPQAGQQAQRLQETGSALSQETGSPLQPFGQNLAEGDYLAAAEALRSLDTSNLSPSQAEALARQLESAAESLQATSPDLAQQLREAAQAVRKGDTQAAGAALERAAQELTETGQQIVQSERARQAAEQIGEGRRRVITAGRGAQGQQGENGQPEGEGQAAEGEGQGQGNQSGQGQNGSRSGAGRGEGSGEGDSGSEVGTDPIEQNNGPGDGGERGYEEIYAPELLGGNEGEDVALPGGEGDPGDEIVGEGSVSPGDDNRSRVPYADVFAAYAEAFRQAIESGEVPVHLRAIIKDYFSSLEP